MAMFREHIAAGAIISMVVVVMVYFYALLTDPWLLAILFTVTIIGSFLPDVDSDSGMPFYLVFGTATLAATGVVLLYVLAYDPQDWRILFGVPAVALLGFWFVIGGIVKRWTEHRGIFHSLPALGIAGAVTFLIARHYGLDDMTALVFGGAMAVGFASHLVLDELHAGITLDGIPFNPKRSLGTALKLFSDSRHVNVATYVLLAALMYTAFQTPRAEAYFYNDSDIIEIEDGEPAPPPPGYAQSGYAGSGVYAQSAYTITVVNGSNPTTPTNPQTETPSTNTPSSGGASIPGDIDGDGDVDADDVLALLFNQGVFGGSSVQTGRTETVEVNAHSSLPFLTVGPGGTINITINGRRVRAAFAEAFDFTDLLTGWKGARSAKSPREFGLIAASTALGDSNFESATFTGGGFEITYRSRGYLLAVIPWSFPVRITVVPDAGSLEGRVVVKLPWYRFFVREFFTPSSLAREIDDIIRAEVGNLKDGEDARAVLFSSISGFLKRKVGTISETVYLGQ